MEIAITLVAAHGTGGFLEDLSARISTAIHARIRQSWLSDGRAADLVWNTPSPQPSPPGGEGVDSGRRGSVPSPLWEEGQGEGDFSNLKALIAEMIGPQPVDWCIQRAERRRKRMLIADMDSTVIGQECLDEMAELKGIKPQVAAITERSMRGELDFETGLRERIKLLKGVAKADLARLLDRRITLNPGARTVVETMKAHGAHTVLVSGGFTFFTEAIARRAGFAAHRGNSFLWEEDRLSGVASPILGREAKLAALCEESSGHGIEHEEIIAVGDGANDLAMLKAAGLGVAYRAKPIVAAEADAQINHTDLTTLLYFQGYSRAQFAEL